MLSNYTNSIINSFFSVLMASKLIFKKNQSFFHFFFKNGIISGLQVVGADFLISSVLPSFLNGNFWGLCRKMLKMKNRLLPRRTHHSFHRYLVCQNWSRNIEMAYQKRYERLKMSPTPLLTLLSKNQISKSIIPPMNNTLNLCYWHYYFIGCWNLACLW